MPDFYLVPQGTVYVMKCIPDCKYVKSPLIHN